MEEKKKKFSEKEIKRNDERKENGFSFERKNNLRKENGNKKCEERAMNT